MTNENLTSMGKISQNIEKNTVQLKIICWIYEKLPRWRDKYTGLTKENEPTLNSDLCKFLTRRARNENEMFFFHHENPEKTKGRNDFAANDINEPELQSKSFTDDKTLLVIECKRLPAPRKNRELEYVTGLDKAAGGIQRFKMGRHGSEHTIAAMIGYIQKESMRYWCDKINEWISNFVKGIEKDCRIWTKSEKLVNIEESNELRSAKFKSIHSRRNSKTETILIHHLWITLQ